MRKTITLFVLIMLVACSPRPPEDGIIVRAQYGTAMKNGEENTRAVTIANHGKRVQRLERVDVSNTLYRVLRLWPRDPRFRNEMFDVENCISFAFHDISVLPDEMEELLITCKPHMQSDVEGIIDVVIVKLSHNPDPRSREVIVRVVAVGWENVSGPLRTTDQLFLAVLRTTVRALRDFAVKPVGTKAEYAHDHHGRA